MIALHLGLMVTCRERSPSEQPPSSQCVTQSCPQCQGCRGQSSAGLYEAVLLLALEVLGNSIKWERVSWLKKKNKGNGWNIAGRLTSASHLSLLCDFWSKLHDKSAFGRDCLRQCYLHENGSSSTGRDGNMQEQWVRTHNYFIIHAWDLRRFAMKFQLQKYKFFFFLVSQKLLC